jgi:hypothetical protein
MRIVTMLLFLVLLMSGTTRSQPNHLFNLIVTIDDNIIINLDRFQVILQTGKGADTLYAEYVPGRLQFKKEIDIQKSKNGLKQVVLVFL